jgi:hypothetical protein
VYSASVPLTYALSPSVSTSVGLIAMTRSEVFMQLAGVVLLQMSPAPATVTAVSSSVRVPAW